MLRGGVTADDRCDVCTVRCVECMNFIDIKMHVQ